MNIKRILTIACTVSLGVASAMADSPGLKAYYNNVKNGYNYWLYTPPANTVPLAPAPAPAPAAAPTPAEIVEEDLPPVANLVDEATSTTAPRVASATAPVPLPPSAREKNAEPGASATAATHGRLPLVIFLHGRSLCGSNLQTVRRYGSIAAIDRGRKIDAYILAPQNPGSAWSPERIMNIVRKVVETNPIDTTRIYVLGMSLGGYGTMDMVARYPDKIAAAIPMCGGTTSKDYEALNKVPMWIVHGTADAAVPVSASDKPVAEMKSRGGHRFVYDRVPGWNHGAPARLFYLPETYEWLFQHSLADKGRPVHPVSIIQQGLTKNAYASLSRRSASAKAALDATSKSGDNYAAKRPTRKEIRDAAGGTTARKEPAKRADKKSKKDIGRAKKGGKTAEHTIKAGDNLYTIAQRNHVSVEDLKKANNLKSNNIQPGQSLKIPKSKAKKDSKSKDKKSKKH